jgi:hypothetical protein
MYKIYKGQTDISNSLQTVKFLYTNINYSSDVKERNGQKHKKYKRKHFLWILIWFL